MGLTQRLGTIPLAIQTDSSNNVGIGGTPSGSFKLEVIGASKLSGFLGVNGSPATSFPFEAYINSSTAYTSSSRGNVMRVYNSNTGANVFAGIELGGAGTANDGLAGINAAVTGSGSASLNFYTRNSGTFEEKLRLDSNGQLNMSPYHSNAKFCPGADSNHYLRYLTSLDGLEMSGFSGLMFSTLGGTERMRITSGGNVGLNTTNPQARLHIAGAGGSEISFAVYDGNARRTFFIPSQYYGYMWACEIVSNGGKAWSFGSAGGGGEVGTIVVNASSTAYNTTSDYRLKEDLKDFNGLELLSKIKVYDFKWKKEDARTHGVMAHELQEILPYAVSGEKDAINHEGKIEAQSVDYSKIVPSLVKAIQEQQEIINNLSAKVTALENK